MDSSTKNSLVLPSSILACGLVFCTIVGGWFAFGIKSIGHTIDVTGSAQQTIDSDVVMWRITLTRSAEKSVVQDGYNQLSSDLVSLQAYLRRNGLEGTGVTIGPVSIEPIMSYNDPTAQGPTAYTFHQDITVTSQDIAKVTSVAQNAASLIGKGALISTTSLEYYYSKLAALKIAMLSAATKDAQSRARSIAESAGASLGPLRSANMGVFQVTAPNSTDISDSGTYDTSSVRKQITAIVRASFGVK